MPHPSLEGIGTPWVRAQESRQHPVLLDTKPNKMTAAILNWYGSFLSSGTQISVTKPELSKIQLQLIEPTKTKILNHIILPH